MIKRQQQYRGTENGVGTWKMDLLWDSKNAEDGVERGQAFSTVPLSRRAVSWDYFSTRMLTRQ
jgi:hypothetical protein